MIPRFRGTRFIVFFMFYYRGLVSPQPITKHDDRKVLSPRSKPRGRCRAPISAHLVQQYLTGWVDRAMRFFQVLADSNLSLSG